MSEATELRIVRIVGPRLALAKSDQFTWQADLSVAYLGIDRPDPEDIALVNYTQDLRVLLQAPESDARPTLIEIKVKANSDHPVEEPAINETAQLRAPHLLIGNVHPRGSKLAFADGSDAHLLRAAVPEDDPDKGKRTRGFSSLVLTPVDPWPTPQANRQILVPRLAIAEQRLRVLISVSKKKPEGFLRLAKISDTTAAAFVGTSQDDSGDPAKLPRLELKLVKAAGKTFVAADLTPDGVELRGTIANPLKSFGEASEPDRVPVIVRLVHKVDSLSPDQATWSLELVREEDEKSPDRIGDRVRKALTVVRAAFAPGKNRPLVLDIDTAARDPAVRWPLDLKDKSLRLIGAGGDDWRLWVDAAALRARLRGSPVRNGELPTEVAFVPDLLAVSRLAGTVAMVLDADRRDAAGGRKTRDEILGPRVTLTQTGSASSKFEIADAKPKGSLTWFLDQDALARNVADRYRKAGVHPAGVKTTYAFIPLSDGWLQLPLRLDGAQAGLAGAGVVSDAISFEGSVIFGLDDPMKQDQPRGRRLEVVAADYVHASSVFAGQDATKLTIDLSGSAGTVDGLLWVAAVSPSPENILPQFDAGPSALMGPTLAFSRLAAVSPRLMPLTSGTFAPDEKFALDLPATKGSPSLCYLWRGYDDLPLVTAIGMTRTAESSGNPSSTRGLLCRQFDRASCKITLSYGKDQGFASLKLTTDKDIPLDTVPLVGGDKGPFRQVPVVPVTLPGIELRADQIFDKLQTHLRFDLPLLDELFANTRLPAKAPVNTTNAPPEPPPPDAPTSLDFDRLMLAWQKTVDRLDLSRVDVFEAFDFTAQTKTVDIKTLFEGATWTTDFALSTTVKIDTREYAFGTYRLDKTEFSGRTALQGLTKAFDVDSNLGDARDDSKNPLRIIGFAAALWEDTRDSVTGWRDTRAAITAKMPAAAPFKDGDFNGLLRRDIVVIDPKDNKTAPSSRVTLARPIPLGLPAEKERTLGLWFRDLALEKKNATLNLVRDPDGAELSIGPRQSAFDRSLLPRSIHEWRLCNDANEPSVQPPSSYEIALGPFRFRPLRLLDLVLANADGWTATSAKICGTLSLANASAGTLELGPFEPEFAYATGNLVAIAPAASKEGLTFAGAGWESVQVDINAKPAVSSGGKAQLSFRLAEVDVFFGSGKRATGSTTALLGLTADGTADKDGLPQFTAATLDAVLFGRLVTMTGTVAIKTGEIIASFGVPANAGDLKDASGVLLGSVEITIPPTPGHKPTLTLKGEIKVAAAEAASARARPIDIVHYELGGSLHWLNHAIDSASLTIDVDHRRGVIDILGTLDGDSAQPIVGLTATKPRVRVSLTVAVLPNELETTSNRNFLYNSVSGFGEYNLSSKDGPLKRFDHVIAGTNSSGKKPDPVWTSRMVADLSLDSRESRIHWPIDSLPTKLKTLDTDQDVVLADLAALVSARALRGTLGAFNNKTALRHVATMTVSGQPIATDALRVETKNNKRRVALAAPWTFHALAEHRITDPQDTTRTLTWTTLDHVNAIDAAALVAAAAAAITLPQPFKDGIFAFAGRYKKIEPDEGSKSPVVKGGIVLRAFAQAGFPVEALAIELAKASLDEGIIVTAAGPTTIGTSLQQEGPFWPDMPKGSEFISYDRHGIVLALPWLAAVDEDYKFAPVLSAYDQAPAKATAEWDAPDVDWAAGSPAPLARKPAPTLSIGSGSMAELAALLTGALQRPLSEPVRALSSVEQLFLRRKSGGPTLKERPIWLRSLLALRAVWSATKSLKPVADGFVPIDDRVIMIVPSGAADGGVARFKLGQRRRPAEGAADVLAIGTSRQIIAIDRERTVREALPATEILDARSGSGATEATRRARLVSRAERLVKEPVALLVVAADATVADDASNIWMRVGIPPDLDDGALDIPVDIAAKVRLYASPALGWPTARGTALVATGAMGMGEDRAFQDVGPKDPPAGLPDDVKVYGSGLSGRTASLSLPARANTGDRPMKKGQEGQEGQEGPFVDARAPAYVVLGRKVIFKRPEAAGLPIVSPPARHLSPTEARAIVPVSQDIRRVLERVVKGQAAPIVPPHLERTTFGLRPGAMHAEFDSLLFADGLAREELDGKKKQEDMNAAVGRFGRPAHAGPRLLRQLRPPRAPALPRVPLQPKQPAPQNFVITHGRRTFVEVDDHVTEDATGKEMDTNFPTPFRLFEGVATLLRRNWASYRIRLLHVPLLPQWGDAADAALSLRITSPSYPAGQQNLADALAKLGLLRGGPDGLGATLSIDRFAVRFREAVWSKAGDAIDLTLRPEPGDLADVRSRLDAVDGDSQVILQLRCAKEDDGAATPPTTTVFALATQRGKESDTLREEPRRQFALRVPVCPTAQPSLNVSLSTLVFADPSYDRELSGPGPSDSQRDKSGALWKLALDRFEYGTDTPVYFAFGPIGADGLFTKDLSPDKVKLTLQRQPAGKEGGDPPKRQDLVIAGVNRAARNEHDIGAIKAYGVTLDQLRVYNRTTDQVKSPVEFGDGDQIVVTVGFKDPHVQRTLSVRAMVVPRPIIAPASAVYALVAPFVDSESKPAARVALHATAPLPQRIEFPDLLADLAIGHIRRRALFIWSTSDVPAAAPARATLVKIDRAGGGQLPERASDLLSRLALPQSS